MSENQQQFVPKGEVDNCRPRLLKYCKGQGLDLGCGLTKIRSDAIGIDLKSPFADMHMDARVLADYPDGFFDYVFSSHLLEEIENTEATLREWLRVIKDDGYLVLYQADAEYYYPLGDLQCNKAHVHHFLWEDLWKIIENIGGVQLVYHDRFDPNNFSEWSFELVVQKTTQIYKRENPIQIKDFSQILRIVVPCFNADKYIIECIKSIQKQTVTNWTCYIYDDMSTDRTPDYITTHIKEDSRFIFSRNNQKMYVPGNYWQALNRPEINDNDICINIDGDDWLPDEKVFERILTAYKDPDIWVTYGQFQEYRPGGTIRQGWAKDPDWSTLRKTFDWRATHLRTFKIGLFRKIKQEDLISPRGTFFEAAGDLSFMIPMLEMAGPKHCKLLEDVNYVYNTETPLNDHKREGNIQQNCALNIFKKLPYKKLPNLNIIIFSKNRACQLDLLLRSIKTFWVDMFYFKFLIIWNTDNKYFYEGYQKVIQDHPEFYFKEQTGPLKTSIIESLKETKEYFVFFVDDNVFKEPFKFWDKKIEEMENNDILCISLRMGTHITKCYTQNISSPIPNFEQNFKWKWNGSPGDWGYPMSVDGHIFRTSDIIDSIKYKNYSNPNNFEDALRSNIPNRPYMTCFENSKILNIPINKVGTYPNRHGNISTEFLNENYLKGKKISIDNIKGLKNESPHIELSLEIL